VGAKQEEHRRRWRDYRTVSGARPVRDFLRAQPAAVQAAVAAELETVRREGTRAARHLRGEIYEVRISHDTNIYRILFAPLGRYSQILLSLDAFQKKTRRTPLAKIDVAERRLADWRRQGAARAALKG